MRYLLDLIYFAAFLLFSLCSIVWPKQYAGAVHAFKRNFWGKVGPDLDGRPVIWFHAVSVGEALLCGPLLNRLCPARPDLQFVLSVGTSDGFAIASRTFSEISVFYAPADFSWAISNTFDQLRPQALFISENDFWPNMLNESRRRSVALAIFNTRITPRELSEHRWDAWLLRPGLQQARWWGTVSERDAAEIRRFFAVKSPPLEVTGSLKCDGQVRDPNRPQTELLRRQLGFKAEDRVLVAGSTHDKEEFWLAEMVRALACEFPRIRLVLVPRHVSRCSELAVNLRNQGFELAVASQLSSPPATSAMVTLVDSAGQLRDLWGIGELAFVGGSLVPTGGHNMVEPASYGIPVCFGRSVADFQSVAEDLLAAGGAVQVPSPDAMRDLIRHWMTEPDEAVCVGRRAQEFVRSHKSSLDRTVHGLLSALPRATGLPKTSGDENAAQGTTSHSSVRQMSEAT